MGILLAMMGVLPHPALFMMRLQTYIQALSQIHGTQTIIESTSTQVVVAIFTLNPEQYNLNRLEQLLLSEHKWDSWNNADRNVFDDNQQGVFDRERTGGRTWALPEKTGVGVGGIFFNAARSNMLFGRSETIQPSSFRTTSIVRT